jgi:putative transposase
VLRKKDVTVRPLHDFTTFAFMELYPNHLYHIFNQGNNRQKIFFSDENYRHFLRLVKKFILPHCDILAYCLMPNHFHFLINANEKSCYLRDHGSVRMHQLAFGFRTLLISYAQAVNVQENRTGSLFRQGTKCVLVDGMQRHYGLTAFHYIHQNPWKANLVSRPEDWPYSSFPDYAGFRENGICNRKLAFELLGFHPDTFFEDSISVLDEAVLAKIR